MKRPSSYKPAHSVSHYRTSPVLGILVMIGVTVLLVGVSGVFSFGLAFDSINSPQATMSTQLNVPDDQIVVKHIGGDALSAERTRIIVANESDGDRIEFDPVDGAGTFEVGDTVVITTMTGSLDGWRLQQGSQTFELRRGMTYTIGIVDIRSNTTVYRTSLTTA